MEFMLDTNIIIFAKNNKHEEVFEHLRRYDPSELCISVISFAELEYGVFNSSDPEKNQLALTLFLSTIPIIPFGDAAAVEYGRIRADLRKKGTPIGANDLLIAAHAKSLGLTLITNNSKEFMRVAGLHVKDWVRQ